MSFVERKIKVSIQLAKNTQTNQPNRFAGSGSDTVTIEDLRMKVRIQNSGSPANCKAQVTIFGLSQSLMNQLSTLGLVFNIVPLNKITIAAGDDERGLSNVFSGTIYVAYSDPSQQPDVPFMMLCNSTVGDAVAPAAASSFTGSTSVVTIMQGLARQMNIGFENSGVDVQLASPYFSGSLYNQAKQCAEHARISWGIIDSKLCIWPLGKNRTTPNPMTISPATGMVGFPSFTQQGIIVKSIFLPEIARGSLIKVESNLLASIASAKQAMASATQFPTQWAINKLDLILDSQVPKGDWLSVIYAYNPSYAKGITPPR